MFGHCILKQSDILVRRRKVLKWTNKRKLKSKDNFVEVLGIDPSTSRMLSERSTIWATPPYAYLRFVAFILLYFALLRHKTNVIGADFCIWIVFLEFYECILKFIVFIICFGFKKTNKEISTTRGEIMNLFFQEFFLQTKFRSKRSSVLKQIFFNVSNII